MLPHQFIPLQLCALAIAVIYYSWRDGYLAHLLRQQRDRTRRERVAYMLWVAANRAD
jgi:hypothetical protein